MLFNNSRKNYPIINEHQLFKEWKVQCRINLKFFIECRFVVYLINSSYYSQNPHFYNKWKKIYGGGFSLEQRTEWTSKHALCRGWQAQPYQAKSLEQWGISYDCSLRPWPQNGSTFPQNNPPIDSQIQGSSWCSSAPGALTLWLFYYSIHCLQHLSASFLYHRYNCKLFSVTHVRGLPAPSRPSAPCISHITVL